MSSSWLIVGLGNCGKKYNGTRHNLGREIVSSLTTSGRDNVHIFLPETLMNISGSSIAAEMKRLEIAPQQLIVVYDDLSLPLGKMRIKTSGTHSAGHNGVADVMKNVGKKFIRLKVGTKEERKKKRQRFIPQEDLTSFVLAKFSKAESLLLQAMIPRVCSAIECILEEGTQTAMNIYN